MAVKVEGLDVAYPALGREAVKGFSMRAEPGEIVLLAGPTGCGKSTALMAMAGIIPAVVHAEVRGAVRIGGLDPLASPVHEVARKVGLLFQNVESQLFTASVEDEVLLPLEFGAVRADDPFAAVDRALERFGLLDRRTQKVEALSSGYKQRLALASLHLDGKAVLLLDEPFSYLDPKAVEEFKGILKVLAARGVAVVLAEHREDLALPLADRVVRMDGGEAPPAVTPRASLARNGTPPVLDTQGLGFSYGRTPVLHDVALQAVQGECVCIVGENGCGKTTLCCLLAGAFAPGSGHVLVGGDRIDALKPAQRAGQVALALQNPDRQLFASTVRDEAGGERGRDVLGSLGLWDMRSRHPRSLSFGQKRRLTLAKLLARRPAVLVVDEPSVGQDGRNLASMFEVLGGYMDGGGVLVATTHDHRVTESLGGRILRMEAGGLRPVEKGVEA